MFHLLEDEKEAEKVLNRGEFLVLPTESVYFLAGKNFEKLESAGGFNLKKNLNLVTESWFKKNVKNLFGKDFVVDLFFPGPIVLKVKENLFYITNDQRAVEVLDLVGGCLEGAVLNYIFKIPLTSDFQEFGKIFDLVCYKGGSCDFGFLPAMIELEESGVNFYGTDLFGFQGFFNKNKEGLQSLNVSKDFKFCLNEISSFNLKESKMQVKVDMSDFQEGKSGKIFVLKEAKKGLGLESNMVDLGSVSNMQTVSKNFCKKLVMSSLFDEVESVKVVISKLPKNEYSELFLNEVRWVEGF